MRGLVFRLADREVDQILEPSLDDLLDPAAVRRIPRLRDGLFQDVPYYAVHGMQVWGATAMVFAEFLDLVRRGATASS